MSIIPTKLDCFPSVTWKENKPVQTFVSLENARPLRNELKEMINHQDDDIRDWARSIVEPDEIILILEKDEDEEFEQWHHFYVFNPSVKNDDPPWFKQSSEESQDYQRIFQTTVPSINTAGKVAEYFVSDLKTTWPDWLPVPVSNDSNSEWKTTKDLRQSIVTKRSDDVISDNNEVADTFSKEIVEQAKTIGLVQFYLCAGFEQLLNDGNNIGNIKVQPPEFSRLFYLSVNFLLDNGHQEIIEELLEEHGQSHSMWPIFVKSNSDELLMLNRPDKKWSRTFICLNDGFYTNKKSIWSYDYNTNRKELFEPIFCEGDPEKKVVFYIKNLDNQTIFYSHIVKDDDAGESMVQIMDEVIEHHAVTDETNIQFSESDYHMLDKASGRNAGNKAKFKMTAYDYLIKTSPETQKHLEESLPKLPMFLEASEMDKRMYEHLEVPKLRRQRKDNMYTTKKDKKNMGFLRHIFNLVDENRNYNNKIASESLREIPSLEKEVFDLQKPNSGASPEEIKQRWIDCINSSEGDGKNYAFIMRFITPAVASMEIYLEDESDRNWLTNSLIAASYEGVLSQKVAFPPVRNKNAPKKNFEVWFAYIHKDPDGRQTELLQLDLAKEYDMSRAKGFLTEKFVINHEVFARYRNKAGFSCQQEDIKVGGLPLFSGKKTPQDLLKEPQYLASLWSAKKPDLLGIDLDYKFRGLQKMLLSILDEQNTLPIFHSTYMFNEQVKRQGNLYPALPSEILTRDFQLLKTAKIDWSNKTVSDAEKMVFKWLYDPDLSHIDLAMSKFVDMCDGELNHVFRMLEATWNRMIQQCEFNELKCLERLEKWIRLRNITMHADIVSEAFLQIMKNAIENSSQESLLSRLRKADTWYDALHALRAHPNRINRFKPPNIWKPEDLMVGQLGNESLIITKMESIFGSALQEEGQQFTAHGFALDSTNSNKFWYPLSFDELDRIKLVPQSDIKDEYIENTLVEHWQGVIDEWYQKGKDNLQNGHQTRIFLTEEKYKFFDSYLDYHLLKISQETDRTDVDRNQLLKSLPSLEIIDSESEEFPINNHSGDSIQSGLIIGPSGWHISFDGQTLNIHTSRPINQQAVIDKFKILKKIFSKLGINYEETLTQKSFKRNFSVDYDVIRLCKIDPLNNPYYWYETYSSELINPNQDFVKYFDEEENWKTIDGANRLLDALRTSTQSWMNTDGLSETGNVKEELKMMYDNGMTCTLHDYLTPNQASESKDETSDMLVVVRLHSGRNNNPVGVLNDNQVRINAIGDGFKHLGNTLLVSNNAEGQGTRIGGWRLVAPVEYKGETFLSYLSKNWKELFNNSADTDRIIVQGVVKLRGYNEKEDDLGDICLHKLHLLYIIAFYEVTSMEAD